MLQLLIIAGSYPPIRCGVGDYTHSLAMALAVMPDVQVTILTTGDEPVAKHEAGVTVLREMPNWSLAQTIRLARVVRRVRPDIVHIQYPTLGYSDGKLPWVMPFLARSLGARIVQTWHEGFRRDLAKFALLVVAPGKVVVVREAFVRQFGRAFGRIAGLRRLLFINSAATIPKVRLSQEERKAIRDRHGAAGRRLLVFFGFIQPAKQIEQIFEIANPDTDHVVIVGNVGDPLYLDEITALAQTPPWAGHAKIIESAAAIEAAAIIAAADALVLPLKTGGGIWNTAILAGILQGTFVLTTSAHASALDRPTNVYYARVDDIADMKQALATYAGNRLPDASSRLFDWTSVASRHLDLYRSLLPSRKSVA